MDVIPEARLNLVIYYLKQEDVQEAYSLIKEQTKTSVLGWLSAPPENQSCLGTAAAAPPDAKFDWVGPRADGTTGVHTEGYC